jgi:hypothetical protein
MCRSVKGGTWRTVNFDNPPAKCKILPRHNFTPYDLSTRLNTDNDSDPSPGPPANIHQERIFLIKLQISLFGSGEDMLIYDRQRGFQVMWFRKNQKDLFDEVEEMLGDNLKMFRWAKRDQLSVCFDQVPPQTPLW